MRGIFARLVTAALLSAPASALAGTSMTEEALAAWFPELRAPGTTSSWSEIADLALAGRFSEADRSVTMKLRVPVAADRFVALVSRDEARTRQYGGPDGNPELEAAIAARRAGRQVPAPEIARAVGELPTELQGAAEQTVEILAAVRGCLHGRPRMLAQMLLLKRQLPPGATLPPTPPGMTDVCVDQTPLDAHPLFGRLPQNTAGLLRSLILGHGALAEGNRAGGRDHFMAAWREAASGAGNPSEIAQRLGDLAVSEEGDPEALGPSAWEWLARPATRRLRQRSVEARQAIEEARAWYARAEGAASPRQRLALRLRAAFLSYLENGPAAADDYLVVASEARRRGMPRLTALALVSHGILAPSAPSIEQALEVSAAENDVATLLSVHHLTQIGGAMRLDGGDPTGASAILHAAAHEAQRHGFPYAAADAHRRLASLQATEGHSEAAMASHREAVRLLIRFLDDGPKWYEPPQMPGWSAPDPFETVKLEIGSALLSVALSAMALTIEEGQGTWEARRRELMDDVNKVTADFTLPTGANLKALVTEEMIKMERRVRFLGLAERQDCPQLVTASLELRQQAAEARDEIFASEVDAQLAECDAAARQRIVHRLSAADPVRQLQSRLSAQAGADPMAAWVEFLGVVTLATAAGQADRARVWVEAALPIYASQPDKTFFLETTRASLLLETGDAETARRSLQAIASLIPAWDALRTHNHQRLLAQVEARAGNADAAILAFESANRARLLWLQQRTGTWPNDPEAVRLATLRRKGAIAGLDDLESREIAELGRRLSNPRAAAIPSVSRKASGELLMPLPARTTVIAAQLGRKDVVVFRMSRGAPARVAVLAVGPRAFQRAVTTLSARGRSQKETDDAAAAIRRFLIEPFGAVPKGDQVALVLPDVPCFPWALVEPHPHGNSSTRAVVFASTLFHYDEGGPTRLGRPAVIGVKAGGLEAVEAEAKRVAEILQTRAIVGPDASASVVLRAIGAATTIHIAGHAQVSTRNPHLSAFQLAGNERLEAARLLASARGAHLVVLSGCESHKPAARIRGLSAPIEGLSLASYALTAGVRWVVGTLWRVDDTLMSKLMPLFYEELVRGSAPPEALRAVHSFLPEGEVSPLVVLVSDVASMTTEWPSRPTPAIR